LTGSRRWVLGKDAWIDGDCILGLGLDGVFGISVFDVLDGSWTHELLEMGKTQVAKAKKHELLEMGKTQVAKAKMPEQ
jgi:hypothetical protein